MAHFCVLRVLNNRGQHGFKNVVGIKFHGPPKLEKFTSI